MTNNNFQLTSELLKWASTIALLNSNSKIIIGSSRIDVELEKLLLKFFGNPINSKENLLNHDGPLGTFSVKIKLVERLGLISRHTIRAIDILRRIRNKAAHTTTEINLELSPFADQIFEIKKLLETKTIYKRIKESVDQKLIKEHKSSDALIKSNNYVLTIVMLAIVVELNMVKLCIPTYKRPVFSLNITGDIELYNN